VLQVYVVLVSISFSLLQRPTIGRYCKPALVLSQISTRASGDMLCRPPIAGSELQQIGVELILRFVGEEQVNFHSLWSGPVCVAEATFKFTFGFLRRLRSCPLPVSTTCQWVSSE
jgi:hypothetical protein